MSRSGKNNLHNKPVLSLLGRNNIAHAHKKFGEEGDGLEPKTPP